MKSWDCHTFLTKFISIFFHIGSPTLYSRPKTQVTDIPPPPNCYPQEIALAGSKCSKQNRREEHIYGKWERMYWGSPQFNTTWHNQGLVSQAVSFSSYLQPQHLSYVTVATRHKISFNFILYISSRRKKIVNDKNSQFDYCQTYSHILHFSAPTVKK